MDLTAAYLQYNHHLPRMQERMWAIISAQDQLNEQGNEAIDGQYFISRHEGLACKESRAWKFLSEKATEVMNGKIKAFWKVCSHMEEKWMDENLGGAFVPWDNYNIYTISESLLCHLSCSTYRWKREIFYQSKFDADDLKGWEYKTGINGKTVLINA